MVNVCLRVVDINFTNLLTIAVERTILRCVYSWTMKSWSRTQTRTQGATEGSNLRYPNNSSVRSYEQEKSMPDCMYQRFYQNVESKSVLSIYAAAASRLSRLSSLTSLLTSALSSVYILYWFSTRLKAAAPATPAAIVFHLCFSRPSSV